MRYTWSPRRSFLVMKRVERSGRSRVAKPGERSQTPSNAWGLLATPTLALTQAIKTAKGPRRLEVEFPSGRRSFGWVTISTR
jgi:hypothetical protein